MMKPTNWNDEAAGSDAIPSHTAHIFATVLEYIYTKKNSVKEEADCWLETLQKEKYILTPEKLQRNVMSATGVIACLLLCGYLVHLFFQISAYKYRSGTLTFEVHSDRWF